MFTALLVIGLATGLSACSAGGAGDQDAAGAGGGRGAQWGACMRSAGFDIDDPSDDQVSSGTVTAPQDVDRERFDPAAEQCLTEVGANGADTASKERWKREYDRVASCIREDYPDFPEQQPGTLSFDPQTFPPAGEPEFQDRVDSCLHEYSPDTKTQGAK